jgi:hypothetical protein
MGMNNSIQRSWWRRLARRKRVETPRTNRLSHFEPLEQRTVLSANVFVHGDDFFRGPHEPHQFDAGLDRYAVAPHYEAVYHDTSYAPHSAVPEPLYAPQSLAPPPMSLAASLREFEPGPRPRLDTKLTGGEGETSASGSTLATPTFVGPLFQSNTSYKVEIVIVHDDAANTSAAAAVVFAPAAAPRVTILTPTFASAADNGFFASLAAAALQRRVDPPSYSYPSQSRIGSLNAMSEEPGSAAGKALESTLQSTSSSLLATLGSGSGVTSSSSAHVLAADDDGGSSEHPLSQNAASRKSGDEVELDPADVAGQKRKLASSESRTPVQTRLEDLTDIPVIRITESLFRELLVMYENSSAAASPQSAQAAGATDDGMIELLAADIGAVASRQALPATADHSQPVATESGIALYQTLEVAGLDDIAEVAAATQAAHSPVAPVEQVAKAE